MPDNSSPDYDQLYEAAGRAWNIDPALLKSVKQQESGLNANPGAVSPAGAIGDMQFIAPTAKAVGVTDPTNPVHAIFGAAKLLRQSLDRYGNVPDALRAYNAGDSQTRWNNAETAAYVPGVAKHLANVTASRQASSDDVLNDFVSGGGSAAPSAPAAKSAPDNTDDVLKDFVGPPDNAPAAPAQAAPTPAPTPAASSSQATSIDASMPPGVSPATATAIRSARGALGGTTEQAPVTGLVPGLLHGAQTILGNPVNRLVSAADQAVPALGALDRATGLGATNTPDQMAAREAAYQQQYGNNPLAAAGNVAAQTGIIAASPLGLAGRALEAGGGALLGGASLPLSVASRAAGGALQGAGVAAASGDNPIQAAGIGAGVGAALPVAGAIGNALIGKVPVGTAQLAQRAEKLGIPVYGGQVTSSPSVRVLDSVTRQLPLSGAKEAFEAQKTAVNQAIANELGTPAEKITPDVMRAARDRIGNSFDNVATKTSIPGNQQLFTPLVSIAQDAQKVLGAKNAGPIMSQVKDIADAVGRGNGSIDGETYQALTRVGAPLNRLTQSNDPNIAHYADKIKDALDDALEASAPPGVQNQLQQARYQWRVMKTIEPLINKSTTGDVSPTNLLQAVVNSGNKLGDPVAYGGGGTLGDIGRIGTQFMREPPDSGTAQRLLTQGGLLSAGAGLLNPVLAGQMVGSAGGSLALGRAVQGALRSKLYTNRLIQNSLGATNPDNLLAITSALAPATAAAAANQKSK